MYIEFLLCAERRRFYAITSLSPSAMFIELAYSMCRTRLGASDCDFDDAWTIRGRIARSPPRGTRQSAAAIRVERSWSDSSVSTPNVWVPGKTRKGPFSLSITHKFSAKGKPQLDVGQAGQTSPNDRVSGGCVAGTREIAPESRDPDQVSRD